MPNERRKPGEQLVERLTRQRLDARARRGALDHLACELSHRNHDVSPKLGSQAPDGLVRGARRGLRGVSLVQQFPGFGVFG